MPDAGISDQARALFVLGVNRTVMQNDPAWPLLVADVLPHLTPERAEMAVEGVSNQYRRWAPKGGDAVMAFAELGATFDSRQARGKHRTGPRPGEGVLMKCEDCGHVSVEEP